MKFNIILLVVFAIWGGDVSAQRRLTTAKEREASNIIRFSNTVIDLGNMYRKSLQDYEYILSTADGNIKELKKNSQQEPSYINCYTFIIQSRHFQEYTSEASKVQSFIEKEEIKRRVSQGKKDVESVAKWCSAMSEYFTKEKYKEDPEFAKYPVMRDSLSFYAKRAEDSWTKASATASSVGNKAKITLLSSNPLAEFVIPMKTDIMALRESLRAMEEEIPNYYDIKRQLSFLSVSIEKNKNTKKLLKDAHYKSIYSDFYSKFTTTISDFQELITRIEHGQSGDNLDTWYTSVTSGYSKLIKDYNTFADE